MFPETDCGYPLSFQLFCNLPMPQSISGDFGLPEYMICLWDVTASSASVPKASVDKNREIAFGKEKVRSARYPLWMHGPSAHFGTNQRHP
jgi:hypothetical protein